MPSRDKRTLSLLNSQGGGGLKPSLSFDFTQGTMVAQRGGVTPTFTRATVRTIIDFEGCIRNCVSGEVPFYGLRRVKNLLPITSENFSDATWAKSNSTVAGGVTDPLGGSTAFTLTATGANGSLQKAGVSELGDTLVSSWWIRRRTGTGQINMLAGPNGGTIITSAVTGEWQRISVQGIADGSSARCTIILQTSGDEVDIWRAQIENVNRQANQNPSEYVSVGALSTPFHGANVDGVKYFNTLNGNTVNSNVVTEANGALLALDGSGPGQIVPVMGYYPENSITNLCLQSSNFGTTWAAVGTPTRSAAAKYCGDIALDLIGDDSAVALEGYTQAITFTGNAVKSISLLFAKGTSTSSIVYLQDSTAVAVRLLAAITWTGATPSIAMTTGTLLGIDTLANDVFRARFLTTAVTAANVNELAFWPASDAAFDPAPTGDIYIGGVQAENSATYANSLVPTTTASVIKNPDILSTATGGWFNSLQGSLVASFYSYFLSFNGGNLFDLNDATANESIRAFLNGAGPFNIWGSIVDGGAAQFNAGTANTMNAGAPGKSAFGYALNDGALVLNGGTVVTDATVTLPTVNALNLGHSRGSSTASCGIRNLSYYPTRLPNAKLQQLTA